LNAVRTSSGDGPSPENPRVTSRYPRDYTDNRILIQVLQTQLLQSWIYMQVNELQLRALQSEGLKILRNVFLFIWIYFDYSSGAVLGKFDLYENLFWQM
jgi:hypothetical protein